MPNEEASEEIEARLIVEAVLGIPLVHSDLNGDVDYRFEGVGGLRGVLEVTTVTNSGTKVAKDKWNRESPGYGPAPSLNECWQVWIEDTNVRYRGLLERIEPALAVLEAAGRKVNRGAWEEFWGAPESVQKAAQVLAQDNVVQAMPYPLLCEAEGHGPPHRIDLVRESGWMASGSDAALGLIEDELRTKPDNVGKLRGGDLKHLFVWVDKDTDLDVARPFRGGEAVEMDHFQLPTRAPALLEPLDQLWIVDRATLVGWIWTATDGWEYLNVNGS